MNVEVIPVTPKCPPVGETTTVSTRFVESPTGALNELPPDELVGGERGQWWKRYAMLRQERRAAARARLLPKAS